MNWIDRGVFSGMGPASKMKFTRPSISPLNVDQAFPGAAGLMNPAKSAGTFMDRACFTSTPDSGMSKIGTTTCAFPAFTFVRLEEKSREPVG